jgi:ribosomal-protein-alanine N-acetyltransferase
MTRYLVACTPLLSDPPNHAVIERAIPMPQPLPSRILTALRQLFGSTPYRPPPAADLIVGYVGIWFMADEGHITSIAVKEEYRRLGIGELLMLGGIEMGMAMKARLMTLEARISNTAAHALYEKYGYRRVGVRKSYYMDNGEDAVIMSTDPITSPEYQVLYSSLLDAFRERRGEAVWTLA